MVSKTTRADGLGPQVQDVVDRGQKIRRVDGLSQMSRAATMELLGAMRGASIRPKTARVNVFAGRRARSQRQPSQRRSGFTPRSARPARRPAK
jgi:hypothetical protein